MTIAAARASIKSSLDGISGLIAHDHVPDLISEFPAVVMRVDKVNYTDLTYTFRLLLATAVWDEGQAQTDLDPFLENAGASSIKAALAVDPGCTTLEAERVEKKLINGVAYTGAEILVMVTDTP